MEENNPTMPVRPDLIHAYEQAQYAVYGEPELVLRIGEKNADLDALMDAHNVKTAAYLTAANPHGEAQDDEDNAAAAEALQESELLAGYPWFAGEGRDPKGDWKPEPSILVLGIPLEEAEAIGLSHGQNAIVYAEKGQAPRIVVLV